MVFGVYVFPPSIDLNTCDEAPILALYAFAPLFTLDQLNTFVNDFPSTVIGISILPLAAKDVPVFALMLIVTPSLAFVIVNPVTLGNVPIVGVTDVAPL